MTIWNATNKFGIAIWNFTPDPSATHRLQLLIGEPVHICEESEDWYYGYSLVCNSEKLGIFPKSFTTTQEYRTSIKSTKNNEVIYKYSFDQEVIFTLREWGKRLKQIYIADDNLTFSTAKELIAEVILSFQRCKSGKLTSDEGKSVKIEICDKLDMGNKLLGLDLTVRDMAFEITNPFEMCILEYFSLHHMNDQKAKRSLKGIKQISMQNAHSEQTLDRSSKRNSLFRMSSISFGSQSSSELNTMAGSAISTSANNNYSICVTLSNFICTIRQDMDIVMAIYDAKDCKFISENFIVKWDKQGLVQNIDKLNDIRVVFPDLNKKDISRKLFLVCQVIRIGPMNVESSKVVQYRKSMHPSAKKDSKSHDELRRPCGIAVYDLTDFFNKPEEYHERREIFFPFIPYCDKDSLDSLIRKMTKDSKDQKDQPKTQGFHINIRDLSNSKMHLLEQTSYVARKIGFPEVILPEDFRNDIYLTIVSGEFHKGSKKSERNIEVTATVINNEGHPIADSLSVGTEHLRTSYKTVVYYHEDRPKWMETIKISLSIEDFCSSHLKFTFKHRSSNENKDKNEKPFAIAFISLMNDNGTTLKDNEFELFVYKVDGKKFNESDISYLELPCSKLELHQKYNIESSSLNEVKQFFSKKFPTSLYVCSPKDTFTISIVVCSTKLAQDINIFGLLNWKEKKDSLEEILMNIKNIDGGDVVKFLHDALDALFEIWMDETTPSSHDSLVFNALVTIIGLLLQKKYMHFQQILNDYIERNFSATLIYTKLIECFKQNIELCNYHTVTCMEYIFKFIVRSRTLFAFMNGEQDRESFEELLEGLLELICNLMRNPEKQQLAKVKAGILKYLPRSVTDIISVYDGRKVGNLVVQLLLNIPSDELCWQKLHCMHDLTQTELFIRPDCRHELLPVINATLRNNLLSFTEESLSKDDKMTKCLHIINDILKYLNRQEPRSARADISEMATSLLVPMIDVFVLLENKSSDDSSVHHLWSIIISLLHQMSDYHYSEFFKYLRRTEELSSFLLKLLRVFRNCTKTIFPADWSDMNLVQNSVMLKAMNQIVNFIKERPELQQSSFDFNMWKEIFLTGIAFINQKSLQLEAFSKLKRKRIMSLNRDMRLEMAILVRSLWYFLGEKNRFIPFIIGPLLQVALLPVLPIRQNTIIIFFDMLYVCPDYTTIRNEVITHLDSLVIAGRGDLQFRQLFESAILSYCENHPQKFKDDCLKFVREVSQLIEKLLVYREVLANNDGYESLMSCIVDLLDFYNRIDHKEMYMIHLYKLYDLHVKHQNYNEAAYTLANHSNLLEWSDRPLEDWLQNDRWVMCHTHRELKQVLFNEIIRLFDIGQLWEAGIEYCKKLYEQYENVFFDYPQLSKLLLQMSSYYDNITKNVRVEPEYFHVTYYGKGFPVLLRGKSFIYRGKSYERLVDFTKRLQDQFPKAKLLNKLDEPDEQVTLSNEQYLAIFHVDPVMRNSCKQKFSGKLVDEKIVKYYHFNGINEFTFSRPKMKGDKNGTNEFAFMWIERSEFQTAFELPGILCRAEVLNKNVYELNPLQTAIDTMEKANEKTRNIILRYLSDTDNAYPLHLLLMHLNGIVNSDVQGGVSKYEEAFFQSPDAIYKEEDIKKLKELIANQIPLLELAIRVVNDKQQRQSGQENMDGLYKRIVESFCKMRDETEMKYGKRELPADMKKIKESKLQEPPTEKHRLSNTSNFRLSENRNSVEGSDGTTTLTKRPKQSKPNGSAANLTLRFRRNRRINSDSSNSVYASSVSISQSQSQWYADMQSSMNNLNYIPDTPESFQHERGSNSNSRPSSGHYNHRASIQSHLSIYHYNPSASTLSIAPSMSEISDNELPPPLPAKQSISESNSLLRNKADLCKQAAFEDNNNNSDIYQLCKRAEKSGSQ